MSEGTVPHEGLTHLKTYDVKDSNVELIGSKVDHEVKYKSAETEPAWQNVGQTAGLFVWRIEQFQVIRWPKEKHGQFHEGDSYVVLSSRKAPGSQGTPPTLQHDIFFWLGEKTTQDEAGTAAYKTVELDEHLHGKATQHRELQASPSSEFLALFPRITILQGGVRTGFRHVEERGSDQTLILYRVTKIVSPTGKASTLVKEVEPTIGSLVEDDCFILDRGSRVYIWQGKRANPLEKGKAAQVAHDMTLSRQAQTEVIAQTDSRAYIVLEALGGKTGAAIPSSSASPSAPLSSKKRPRKLFRLSDESGTLSFDTVCSGVPIKQQHLDTNDVFILDTGLHIWVWQGAQASANERAMWLKVTQAYMRTLDASDTYAHLTPVAKVNEGNEGLAFRAALDA